jgi:hypothetical protein
LVDEKYAPCRRVSLVAEKYAPCRRDSVVDEKYATSRGVAFVDERYAASWSPRALKASGKGLGDQPNSHRILCGQLA